MGGNIAIIKKHNNKIESVDGYTNSFLNVTKDIDFYINPDNEKLKKEIEYFTNKGDILNGIQPSCYGIFFVDYDNKNIYTINGYSHYLNIEPSSIMLEERKIHNNKTVKSIYHKFFDNNVLAIETIVSKEINEYEYKILSEKYENISEIKNFKDLYDVIYWLEGDRYNILRKNKGHSYVKNGNITTYRNLWIDYKKLGWNYYNFDEDMNGYFELFKQLRKDGIYLSKKETEEWNNFLSNNYDDDEEEDFPNFKQMILEHLRKEKLKRITKE